MNQQKKSLIRAYVDGVITPEQFLGLEQALRSEEIARELFLQELNLHAALEEIALSETESCHHEPDMQGEDSYLKLRTISQFPKAKIVKWPLAVAVVAVVVAVMSSLQYSRTRTEPAIATVSGISGPLQWTGNDGRVVHQLRVGDHLSGGTIDGLSPEAWFELEFQDGSSVTISGNSTLIFSDQEQKQLHLKSGKLSASIVAQPAGKPMLIHTSSALLTVVGTSFEVEADIASTGLNVMEGEVRLKRLSDGKTIDIPANHRVISAPDRELVREQLPASVDYWKSQLSLGPDHTYGQWFPENIDKPAALKAIPFVPQENQSVTLHMLGLAVSHSGHSPVMVAPDSRFLLQGRVDSEAGLFFGFSVANENGEYAGKFLAKPNADDKVSGDFEKAFRLADFGVDPSVRDPKAAKKPEGLVLTGVWCFTLTGAPTGLEMTEVELIPASPNGER